MTEEIKVGDLWIGTGKQWVVVKTALILQIDDSPICVGNNNNPSGKWPIKALCLRQFPGEPLEFATMRFSVNEILSFEKICSTHVYNET
jgi:hypothetical protein